MPSPATFGRLKTPIGSATDSAESPLKNSLSAWRQPSVCAETMQHEGRRGSAASSSAGCAT
ncbi:MAG TPA: hypothetical protein VFR18_07735, partial [Terriglobia bacterium]|nr:hypothetical protein [Terriglobia bacterium]